MSKKRDQARAELRREAQLWRKAQADGLIKPRPGESQAALEKRQQALSQLITPVTWMSRQIERLKKKRKRLNGGRKRRVDKELKVLNIFLEAFEYGDFLSFVPATPEAIAEREAISEQRWERLLQEAEEARLKAIKVGATIWPPLKTNLPPNAHRPYDALHGKSWRAFLDLVEAMKPFCPNGQALKVLEAVMSPSSPNCHPFTNLPKT